MNITVTMNIGTDRNGNGETNPDQTRMEVYRWANQHGGKVSHQWALSPAIGDWPAEDIMVARVVFPSIISVESIRELCDITQQHAIAVMHGQDGHLIWSDNLPDGTERYGFNVDYFHTFKA